MVNSTWFVLEWYILILCVFPKWFVLSFLWPTWLNRSLVHYHRLYPAITIFYYAFLQNDFCSNGFKTQMLTFFFLDLIPEYFYSFVCDGSSKLGQYLCKAKAILITMRRKLSFKVFKNWWWCPFDYRFSYLCAYTSKSACPVCLYCA